MKYFWQHFFIIIHFFYFPHNTIPIKRRMELWWTPSSEAPSYLSLQQEMLTIINLSPETDWIYYNVITFLCFLWFISSYMSLRCIHASHPNTKFPILKPFNVVVHCRFTDCTESNKYRCKFSHSNMVLQFAYKTFSFISFFDSGGSSVEFPIYFRSSSIDNSVCVPNLAAKIKASNPLWYMFVDVLGIFMQSKQNIQRGLWAMRFIFGVWYVVCGPEYLQFTLYTFDSNWLQFQTFVSSLLLLFTK